MEFNENNTEKDNESEFLPENGDSDDDAISWEDLLKAGSEPDAILGAADIGHASKSAGETEPASPMSMENEENKKVNKEKKETTAFDLRAAADNYVNSISPDEAGVEPVPSEKVYINPEDELLLSSGGDDKIAADKDLSGVVDDELLNLLETKKEDEAPSEVQDLNEVQADEDLLNTPPLEASEEDELPVEPPDDEAAVYDDMDFIQQPKKPARKSPFALIAGVLTAGIAAALFVAFSLLSGGGSSENSEVALNPNSNYNSNTDEQMQKQTEELINKVGDKNTENANEENKDKIVVHVSTGGRANPFVPASMFDDSGNAALGADLSVPPDVIVDSPEAVAARQLMTISVSGIMYDPQKPSAILRFNSLDYFVQKGDRIDSYIVKQITKDYVAIGNGANIYRAYVGEAFKLDETIPPNNQMQILNGRRQYISASDIQISTR